MVTERNWLEVYPYTKWGGNDSLPHLQEGQTFLPSHLMLKEVCSPADHAAASLHDDRLDVALCCQKLTACLTTLQLKCFVDI